MSKSHPVITGLGFAVPPQVWDNHRLARMVETSHEWIRSRTGIVTRHIASDDETTATLGAEAARMALQNAVSVAAMMLTTTCMITDLPEKKKAPAGPGGGGPGMGGMGDMDDY